METLRIIVYIIVAVLAIAAVKTALPNQTASKPCILGYKAACSFTPVSTLILAIVAVALLLVSGKLT